jgi:hypothetical protein
MNLSNVAEQYLHNALDRVQNDTVTPCVLSNDMIPLLIDLSSQRLPNQQALGSFLQQLPSNALVQELLHQLIPLEKRALVTTLRTMYDDLQIRLENELRILNFEAASKLREKKSELVDRIKNELSEVKLQLSSSHLKHALIALGWTHSLEEC